MFCHDCAHPGMGENEMTGLPFRIANDLAMVAYEKKPMPLSKLFHQIITVNGIATFELANHEIIQKTYQATRPHALEFKLERCITKIDCRLWRGRTPCQCPIATPSPWRGPVNVTSSTQTL